MRRFLWLLSALLLLAVAACHSSENYTTSSGVKVHYLQNRAGSQERQIELIVPAQFASDGSFMRAMNHAAETWNRSPYINIVLDSPATIPTQCDPGWHCIVATRRPMNGGVAYVGWDSAGHKYGLSRIEFDSAPWYQPAFNNAGCHEIGHQLGLKHSSDGTMGPCQGGATDWDLELVRQAHAHSDAVMAAGTATDLESQARAGVRVRAVGHSREVYERMARSTE